MRTLKKSLALVLALVMVLGLGVVGASADNKLDDYTDAKDIGDAYVEAVGVMTGLEIVDGMTETTIDPTATYTREQAAKIISYMVLGKSAADSLTCTVAPFDDVAADRWSAGYISFCVEQGIIDGMTDTTFEPTGTLTGFQWAKMLLSAVGFNANGEFTGDSWSLNTARVAHSVGLFTGDAAGADHVALQRQQAMLYAFNTLTSVKCVVWSEALGDYIYKYDFVDRYTYNGTLGENVFHLKYAEGIIVDNEGMGASATKVSTDYATKNVGVEIKADTGLDMMYHAARVWYVDGSTNTGVYTVDLAKTTEYDCYSMDGDQYKTDLKNAKKVASVEESLTIGDKNDTEYERYLIDNTATKDGYAVVTLYADTGVMGYMGSKNTVVAGTTVANDDIATDISKLKVNDQVIYVVATSTTEGSSEAAWYVYPVSTTSGVVKSLNRTDGVVVSVTLTDGTVLPLSKFFKDNTGDEYVVGNVYTFVLDTHGHIMNATKDGARDLYVFTGDGQWAGNFNDWNVDWVYKCRFLNVTTGEELTVPVVKSDKSAFTQDDRGEYYDISASTTSKGLYVATEVTANSNPYAAQYVIDDFTVVNSNSTSESVATGAVKGNTVYFDNEDILFLVATGRGASMEIKRYTGIAALKDGLNVASNGTVEFKNAVFTVSKTLTGHNYASVCFVLDQNVSTTSNYVFIPTNVSRSEWIDITGDPVSTTVSYEGAYLEGEKLTVTFNAEDILNKSNVLERGFYSYVYKNGVYELKAKISNAAGELCFYQSVTYTDTNTDGVWLFNNKYTAVDGEVKVVDLTKTGLEDVTDIWAYDQTADIRLAFTVNPNTHHVDYIYVVGAEYYTGVTVTNDSGSRLTFTTPVDREDKFDVNAEGNAVVTLTLTAAPGSSWSTVKGITYHVDYGITVGGTVTEKNISVNGDVLTLYVPIVGNNADIVITGYTT